MLMKVFNKGQVVIPANIRNSLGIQPGDMVDVALDEKDNAIILKKQKTQKSRELAGSLARFVCDRPFPTKEETRSALVEGIIGKNDAD